MKTLWDFIAVTYNENRSEKSIRPIIYPPSMQQAGTVCKGAGGSRFFFCRRRFSLDIVPHLWGVSNTIPYETWKTALILRITKYVVKFCNVS